MKNSFLLFTLVLLSFTTLQAQTYTTGIVNLSNTSGLAMTAKIDVGTQVTLTLTGPSGRWFALGFDASSMSNGTDVVGVHSAGTLSAFDCNLIGFTAPATDAQQNWTITSDVVSAGTRTIIATRALNTGDANDYVFPSTPNFISLIWARSGSASFSYSNHGGSNRGSTSASFTFVPPPAPPAAPTGAASQTFCSGATVAQLSATGTAIQWYATPTGGSPLANSTLLINGSTYYATQTVNNLQSTNRLAVTVTINTAPNAPSAINGPLHFCANSLGQSYSIGSVPGATSYVWTTPTGSTGSSTNNNISLLFNPNFQNGILSVTAQNTCGQSSPVSITISQHLPSNSTLDISTCVPYSFNGQTYAQSGTYSYQGTTIWGCDSSIILNLTISPTITTSLNADACGSYPWNGQSLTNSGIYIDSLQTSAGCDSIVTLNLNIYPIDAITIDSTVLDVFIWNGTNYTASGTYTQFFTSINGCDSTVTINLTIEDSGLDELTAVSLLYPNPVEGNGAICIDGLSEMHPYHIYTISGELIQTGRAINSNIVLKNLPNGNYFIQLKDQRYPFIVE